MHAVLRSKTNSLKQQSTNEHVPLLAHIILIPRQPVSYSCSYRYSLVLGLTQTRLNPWFTTLEESTLTIRPLMWLWILNIHSEMIMILFLNFPCIFTSLKATIFFCLYDHWTRIRFPSWSVMCLEVWDLLEESLVNILVTVTV